MKSKQPFFQLGENTPEISQANQNIGAVAGYLADLATGLQEGKVYNDLPRYLRNWSECLHIAVSDRVVPPECEKADRRAKGQASSE